MRQRWHTKFTRYLNNQTKGIMISETLRLAKKCNTELFKLIFKVRWRNIQITFKYSVLSLLPHRDSYYNKQMKRICHQYGHPSARI